MFDFDPATATLRDVLASVEDEHLSLPTPCPGMPVSAVVRHVWDLADAFRAAAVKDPLDVPGGIRAEEPPADWRTSIPARLDALADAWREPGAWTGMTAVGGVDLPGAAAAVVGLDEIVVHCWDLARAIGRPYSPDAQALEIVHGFLEESVAQNPDGTPGLFGAPVPVPSDAPLVDRVVALAGRDPRWTPGD